MENIIDRFLSIFYVGSSSMPDNFDWKNADAAKAFLNKYYLSSAEYEQLGFCDEHSFFITRNNGFHPYPKDNKCTLLVTTSNVPFEEEEFEFFKSLLATIKEKYFYVIEYIDEETQLRLKLPSDISWGELSSGSMVSMALLYYGMGIYNIYTASGKYGAHIDNYSGLKFSYFELLDNSSYYKYLKNAMLEEEEYIKKELPEDYLNRINW